MNDELGQTVDAIGRIGKRTIPELPGVMTKAIKDLTDQTSEVLGRARLRGKALHTLTDDHTAVLDLEKRSGKRKKRA